MTIGRLIILCHLLLTLPLFAQYRTEAWDLNAGWNAIYLNIDPGTQPLDELLSGDTNITEIWQWLPADLDPSLLTAPGEETAADEWRVWRRDDLENTTFSILLPHHAYLVHTTAGTQLSLKGEVLAPLVRWRTDGVNLIGFPSASAAAPKLTEYLSGTGIVDTSTEIYHYQGATLTSANPQLVPARLTDAKRGRAFWIRSSTYSDFYGPVSVDVALDSGLHYGTEGSLKRLVLRNRTDSAVTVTVAPTASESAPGETNVPTAPALRIRENDISGAPVFTPLGGGTTLTIPAGDAKGISLSVDRTAMSGLPGDRFAGLLRITDAGGLTEIYLPVTAEKTSLAGLWLGEARITKVQNQLQRFQRELDGTYSVDAEGKHIPLSSETGLNATAQTFNMRLLVHVDDSGSATLLSQVFAGVISDDGEGTILTGLATGGSSILPHHLKTAVRLSSANFPTNLAQEMSGTLAPGSVLTATVSLGANHSSNPFIHTYHPDHDNKDARFENTLPPGIESHQVNRAITLTLNDAVSPGEGPQWGTTLLSGTYAETVTGIHKHAIAAAGIFTLGKVSDIAVLQIPTP